MPFLIASAQPAPAGQARMIELPGTGADAAYALAFAPDGRDLAVGTANGIRLFDTGTLQEGVYIPTQSWVRSLAYSPDGGTLAAGLFDNTARAWQMPGAAPQRTLSGFGGWVRSVVFSPDGSSLFTISDDNVARRWGLRDGSLQLKIESLQGARVIALSPDGRTLAIGMQDNTIQLRSASDGSLVRTLAGHMGWVRSLAFSPDGTRLASGAFDATARLWNVASGTLERTLSGHQSSVLAIAFSPDGSTVATGSVDRTVKLWNASDGALLHTLQGHTSFVYSLAFSPDGRQIASGASDNTVRIWDLAALPADVPQPQDTPHECRACHHPPSSSSGPAIVQVRCDACHAGGANLNWCPYFTRARQPAPDLPLSSLAEKIAGVPVPAQSLAVNINSPANGESLYSAATLAAPVLLAGQVESRTAALSDVKLQLDVYQGGTLLTTLTKSPQPDGTFAFQLAVNPHGNMLRINNPAARMNCASCHDEYNPDAYLPAGDLRLRLTATNPAGEQATDERRVTADIGTHTPLEVNVEDAASGEPMPGVLVQAVTKFYLWRGRTATAISNADGAASLNLESLTQATVAYQVNVPLQVIDGLFYSGQQLAAFTIQPGSPALKPVTVQISAAYGQISGKLSDGARALPPRTPVNAFKLPAGPMLRTEAGGDGSFTFHELRAGQYAVFVDPSFMAAHELAAAPQSIDLTRSPSADVTLKPTPLASSASGGTLQAAGGGWLPFAQVTTPEEMQYPADGRSGTWALHTFSTQTLQLTASAPGYYGTEFSVSPRAASGKTITLQPRPDTRQVDWGSGGLTLPAETQATVTTGRVDMLTGWLWGQSATPAPLLVTTPEAEIRLSQGRFALERASGSSAWLTVFEGQAQVRSRKTGQELTLKAGEMLSITGGDAGWAALPYDPAIYQVLAGLQPHSYAVELKLSPVQQAQDWLAVAGIRLAQSITFITYIIAISSLTLVPIFTLLWWFKSHTRKKESEQSHAKK